MSSAVSSDHCDDFFFFNDTATTEIYTLSLHDALPILMVGIRWQLEPSSDCQAGIDQHLTPVCVRAPGEDFGTVVVVGQDRKSTRLNSSHSQVSYAVFCLKKKNTQCV